MNEKDEILADLELLKKELAAKTEEPNMGAPEIVYIEHDDYHAKYIGRTADGLQFFFPPIFSRDEFVVLFLLRILFNPAGHSHYSATCSHQSGHLTFLSLVHRFAYQG